MFLECLRSDSYGDKKNWANELQPIDAVENKVLDRAGKILGIPEQYEGSKIFPRRDWSNKGSNYFDFFTMRTYNAAVGPARTLPSEFSLLMKPSLTLSPPC